MTTTKRHSFSRRRFLQGGGVLAAVIALARSLPVVADSPASALPALGDPTPFDHAALQDMARALAARPFTVQEGALPEVLSSLGYDGYRDIRYRAQARLWSDDALPFQADLMPAGFLYRTPVEIHLVENGQARQVRATGRQYEFGPAVAPAPADDDAMPLSGFRLRSTLNSATVWDEFFVAQGGSYFRAVARHQGYGLSARGLALKTADPDGEEFPLFRSFWLERPDPGQRALVLHALLDSPSTTGAYRFTVRPGDETVVDVEQTLFPRRDLDSVGFAPLTSMFLFDASDRARVQDFRNGVHDSSGLRMLSAAGEWIWRHLRNPTTLQISAFGDSAPLGFGLMQAPRDFGAYEDLEARYERRPSLWVEPLGDWGDGSVELVELPTAQEFNDNIIAFWRPKTALRAGGPWPSSFRLHWGDGPAMPANLARVATTRAGVDQRGDRLVFVIDFVGAGADPSGLVAEARATPGVLSNTQLQANPETGGLRLAFDVDPAGEPLVELRARLLRSEAPVSETWLYRWTAG